MKVVLGSESKCRKLMLEEMGITFEIMPANIDEKAIRFEDPKELTLTLAYLKADAIISKLSEAVILITSDQIVLWNGKILEKPESPEEAKRFFQGYNVYDPETVTSVVVTNTATGKSAACTDIAKVYFLPLTNETIDKIIERPEVYEYAGGFDIDGPKWAPFVKKIEGTRDSIMGLPKEITRRLMEEVM